MPLLLEMQLLIYDRKGHGCKASRLLTIISTSIATGLDVMAMP